MRRIICIIFLTLANYGLSQTFTTSPSLALADFSTTTHTQTVGGIGIIDCDYGLAEVCISISHNRDSDLDIFLTDPNGDTYELSTDNGGNGNNYIITCFDMTAGTNVTAGTAPFNGSYRPEGDLGLVNNGQDADGTWTLVVTDDRSGTSGTLNSWSLVFASTPPCPPVPTTADCGGGTTVCSDETFTGNSIGSGNYSELSGANDGCLSGEHQSSWYFFQAASAGTYAFTIETAVDYDFAVWGPYTSVVCPPVGAPIRCSYSGELGNTGLLAGAGDDTEGSGGDAFVNPITAAVDDIYVIIIDNFTSDGTSFDLTWTLSGGATFDCTLLPVELISFDVERVDDINLISWKTLSERNNAQYIIEKSPDGQTWKSIAQLAGAGNSSSALTYNYSDIDHSNGIVYYRLTQVDFDGKSELLGEVSVNNGAGKQIQKIVNLLGVEVEDSYKGLKIYIYTDGTSAKVISE